MPNLSSEQIQFYQQYGYLFPLRVLNDTEVLRFRREFDTYTRENQGKLIGMIPRERRKIYALTHLSLAWVHEIVSHPSILDAVEGLIGPNILVWEATWFVKFAHDATYISWHQDGAYWGLHPPKVATAWVALSESTPENGCMQVLPGTHLSVLPQRDTYAKDNALSRGQEISVEVDESPAVNLMLRPGEMSLHHIGIAHSSKANTSDGPRIGLAIRYIAPEVVQDGAQRQIVQVVRGEDKCCNFEVVGAPRGDAPSNDIRLEAERRMVKNILADDSAKK